MQAVIVQCQSLIFCSIRSRQDVKFLEEQCKSPQARFLVLNEALNPLVKREASAQNVGSAKELVKKKLEGQ